MVLDTLALVATLFGEVDADLYKEAISDDPVRLICAATLFETSLVQEGRYGDAGGRELDLLVHRIALQVVALTYDHVELAREGFRRFGKGKHPARLNFGDCFAYALCKATGEPLLAKGSDFPQTDLLLVPLQ